jgi:hypothetical protein
VGPRGHEHRRTACLVEQRTPIIALPDVPRDLHTDLFALLWIVVGYTLVVTVVVLDAGRIADLTGRAWAGIGVSILGAGVSLLRGEHRSWEAPATIDA